MSFIFDTSSIFEVLIKGNVKVLNDNYTLEIARYELGNILWRRKTLIKDISDEEYIRLANLMKKILKLLNIINIECYEAEILKVAEEFETTFYDSSFVFIAKIKNTPLITDDENLRRRVKGYIKVMNIEELYNS
ncbi:MAG: type II toxin-antitoxin system VapC family toxin [Candidatus Bathyarchaeia archaeon]